MDLSASSQVPEKSNVRFGSPTEGTSFGTPLPIPNNCSKHLKETISLVLFPKCSDNTGAASIKSGKINHQKPQALLLKSNKIVYSST